jgi:hypothetical protein
LHFSNPQMSKRQRTDGNDDDDKNFDKDSVGESKEVNNLNRLRDPASATSIQSGRNAKLTAHFNHLETRLIEYIHANNVTFVVGCVAWITNFRILEALSAKAGCLFVVQSEEFGGSSGQSDESESRASYTSNYKTRLKKAYDDIKPLPLLGNTFSKELCDIVPPYELLTDTSKLAHPYAIRCAGVERQPGVETNPKMHHKFAVFLNPQGIPIGAWTGSFNWSNCGTKSYENAVYIQDQTVVQGFFAEFIQVLLQSKELAWKP